MTKVLPDVCMKEEVVVKEEKEVLDKVAEKGVEDKVSKKRGKAKVSKVKARSEESVFSSL